MGQEEEACAIEKNDPFPLSARRSMEAFLVESARSQVECDNKGSLFEQVCPRKVLEKSEVGKKGSLCQKLIKFQSSIQRSP